MVKVGDRIRLSSMKGPDREGVVTAVTGSLVRVRWPSNDETTVIPAPGTLTVLAKERVVSRKVVKKAAAKTTKGAKKPAATTRATPKKKKPARTARAAKRP